MTKRHDVHVQAVLSVGVIIYFQGTYRNYIFALSPRRSAAGSGSAPTAIRSSSR